MNFFGKKKKDVPNTTVSATSASKPSDAQTTIVKLRESIANQDKRSVVMRCVALLYLIFSKNCIITSLRYIYNIFNLHILTSFVDFLSLYLLIFNFQKHLLRGLYISFKTLNAIQCNVMRFTEKNTSKRKLTV